MTGGDSSAHDANALSHQDKSRITGLILATAVLGFTALANLPYQYEEVAGQWLGAMETDEMSTFRQHQALPTMAGWPLKYWVRYEQPADAQDRFWSTSGLMANLALGVVAAMLAYCFPQWRGRMIQGSRNRRRTRLMFDAGAALLILALPAAGIGWGYRVSLQHKRIARQMMKDGNIFVSCWLPQSMVDHVPRRLMRIFFRVRLIHTFETETDLEQLVRATPTLVGLSIHGSGLSTRAIELLSGHMHFSQLQLGDRELTAEDIDAIANLRWLMDLRLPETNLDEPMLRRLDHLRLNSVNLSDTELMLTDIGQPGWSSTVVDLTLSRPRQGVSDSLVLDGWPNLKRLSVERYSRLLNPEVLNLELSNLPHLETLRLSRVQKHRLVLRNVPRLATIDEGIGDLRYMLGYDDMMPGLTWVTELEVDGAASLTEVTCFARDLESLKLQNLPNLRVLSLGSYLMSLLGHVEPQPADAARCQMWVDQLGERDGPATLELSMLPLKDADLSALTKNNRIRDLRLRGCGVGFRQIQQLTGMRQLESLDIRSCPLEYDQLTWLLDQFPSIKKLEVDGSTLNRLDLRAGMPLKSLRTTPLQTLQELSIVDVPSLRTHLRMSLTPNHMEIRDAQSLMGLTIEGPWPENATVQGLCDLEWFGGGGPAIDDSLMEVLLQCRRLDQLTLAYASLSRDKLKEIGELTALTLLAVPGADVDDEVTAAWHRLKMLWDVNLDDTAVSVGTIAWLSRLESLRRLSLNRVALNDAAVEILARMNQLSELRVAEVPLDYGKLQPLLRSGNLESLDLSGQRVDQDLLQLLAGPHELKHLVLHGCQIDPDLLQRIVDSNPSMYVDVGTLPDQTSDEMALELRRRAMMVHSRFSRGWRGAFADRGLQRPTARNGDADTADDPRRMVPLTMPQTAGRVNTASFRDTEAATTSDGQRERADDRR